MYLHSLLCLLIELTLTHTCQEFNGIGDDTDDYYSVSDLSNVPSSGFFNSFLAIPGYFSTFLASEPPIQARETVLITINFWNTLAPYQSLALEFFGRSDISNERRFCETADDNDSNTDLFILHRSLSLWYTVYYSFKHHYPQLADGAASIIEAFGIDTDICDTEDNRILNNCYDTSTSWGLAYIITTELYEWSLMDGWNVDGSYNRDVNQIPYQDYRSKNLKYKPKNNPWDLEYIEYWQPLLESDELGFLYYQEFVTPHIGYTGKSFVYTNEEFCQRSKQFKKTIQRLNDDIYDYDYEIELLFDRLSNLNDTSKMEIEFFDLKFNLGLFLAQYRDAITPGIDETNFEYHRSNMAYNLIVYETIIAAWKEKVDFDRVRPPSIIHELLEDEVCYLLHILGCVYDFYLCFFGF